MMYLNFVHVNHLHATCPGENSGDLSVRLLLSGSASSIILPNE
jgi:hypothetical protein